MVYIATVHWRNHKWIPIQLSFIQKNLCTEYKIFSVINGINIKYARGLYRFYKNNVSSHATNLDFLANEICNESTNDNDFIIFLDGDAFPINKLDSDLFSKVEEHELVAIQRIENNGDIQPHPSFCVTTVGFWKKYNCTWEKGYQWKDCYGEFITDVGGNLLKILEDNQINWLPMHRTYSIENDKLAFGIYDNKIYHHCCGFRYGFGGRVVIKGNNIKRYDNSIYVRILRKLKCNWYILSFFEGGGKIKRLFMKKNNDIYKMIKDNSIHFPVS